MDSRMGKYNEDNNVMSRTKRNSTIYSSIDLGDLSRVKTNNNVSVISEAPKQIDIEKIKKYIYAKNDEERESRKRVILNLPEDEDIKIEREEPKDYDINAVLERAKESKESSYENSRYKKFNDREYDILKKIKVDEVDSDITESIDELNTQEKTIVDLINDISKTKSMKKEELFSDLMGDNDNTIVMAPITDEINTSNIREELDNITKELNDLRKPLDDITQDLLLEQEKLKVSNDEPPVVEKIESNDEEKEKKMSNIDKSFFTNSLSFSKKDFEGTENNEEDDEEDEEKGKGFYSTFAIIMIIFVLIATAIIVANYLLDLNWF